MSGERGDVGAYVGWFVFGAIAGAAAAILLAPRSGRETREFLAEHGGLVARRAQERGGDLARQAQRLAQEAQERTGEWLDKGRELFEEQTQKLRGAFEAGRDAMREEMIREEGGRGESTPPRG
jgi:gas vesicle protein